MAGVFVVPYQNVWQTQFARVAAELRLALAAPAAAVVEHVGSTAVPGLCAKPVLDIALGVPSLGVAEAAIPALAVIGFTYRPGYELQIPDRRYFVREEADTPRVHLHAVVLGGPLWLQQVRFRDALRGDPELVRSYAALKRQLAASHASNKDAYTAAKAPFILRVLASRS